MKIGKVENTVSFLRYSQRAIIILVDRYLVPIFLWSDIALKSTRNANIWPKMTTNANFQSNFGPKVLIVQRGSKTFVTLISGNILDTCFVLKVLTGDAPMGRQGRKSVCLGIAILRQKGISPICPGLPRKNFPPPKKFWLPRQGSLPLILDRDQRNLVEPSGYKKKSPH